ncbi:nitroreductase/quinone reductase family protein [Streptomyces sp. NBC_01546]|uniref:nitroreductase/quinone reductase family protein n=1 Tax=Streptomyces sp. NBC_01546 TaxID=2975872 RepID=UPI00386B8739
MRDPDGEAYVLTASNAGADRHPAWYLNLAADRPSPSRSAPRPSRRPPAGPPRPRRSACGRSWWPRCAYAGYREATDREIPLVLVTAPAEVT